MGRQVLTGKTNKKRSGLIKRRILWKWFGYAGQILRLILASRAGLEAEPADIMANVTCFSKITKLLKAGTNPDCNPPT